MQTNMQTWRAPILHGQEFNSVKEKMNRKLLLIKLIHTIIWTFFVIVIFYILLAGIFDKINMYTFIAIGMVMLEGLVLLSFGWRCPLTVAGEKYTDNHEAGFDIFLPKWIAKITKRFRGAFWNWRSCRNFKAV